MANFNDKQAVLLDLDGTVINSMRGIFNALYYMFGRIGIAIADETALYQFIGPSIGATLKSAYGLSQQASEAAVEIYREYYSTKGLLECEAYDGMEALLKRLKAQGKRIALATKKPEVFSKQIISNLGFSPYFDAVCGAKLDDHHDSKAHIIEQAIELLHVSKAETVMVGDTKYDAIGARDAGVDCIGVLYGFGDEQSMKENGATIIVTDLPELTLLLTGESI